MVRLCGVWASHFQSFCSRRYPTALSGRLCIPRGDQEGLVSYRPGGALRSSKRIDSIKSSYGLALYLAKVGSGL